MRRVLYVFLVFAIKGIVSAGENILCSEEYCQRYIDEKDCLISTAACLVQNDTFNGEIFPGDVPCSCCKVCIEHLKEGDFCTFGSPEMPPPKMMCGPGLYCTKTDNEEQHKCRRMSNSECMKQQDNYDKTDPEKIGSYVQRPTCDGDGNYGPIKCNINQTCFCVDEKGKRIFGEAVYTPKIALNMKCECSRLHAKFPASWFKYPVLISRCLEDGSFDPMQCTERGCLCVERDTGSPTSKEYILPENNYTSVSCYSKTIHRSYTYLHDCEHIQWDLLDEIKQSEEEEFTPFDIEIPSCQPDGWFQPVREDDAGKFCIDRYGRKIDPYYVSKNLPEAKNMNCKCARTEYLLKGNKVKSLPTCCSNGNFKEMQCRDQRCYCVDADGIQVSKEVPESKKSSLTCFKSNRFCK